MRKILFLAAFIFTANTLIAQTLLTGIVKDNKNHPVPGASLSIKDSYDGATTDSSGRFSFRTTEKGEQVFSVSAIGFKASDQKITLNGTTQNLTIVLKEEISEMKAVVITAG